MILIVDDQEANIYSLKKLLESQNFMVDTALSGEEALKKVLKNDYALIILDVQMPGIDGFEVAETLSGFNKTKDVPIIFLSAVNKDKKFITKGYASGGIDYVTKPIDPDILMLKVKTFSRLYEQTLALNEIQQVLRSEIEERKKVQQELKEQVDNLYSTLESLPQLAFTANGSGDIEFVNSKWLSYADANMLPATHTDDLDIRTVWADAIHAEVPMELEVRIKELKSEVFRFHLLRIIPIKEKNNQLKWVGTFTDIDDQKQMEKKKDEFLSIASHELKTPLTSIKAYAQLLERTLNTTVDDPAGKYIHRVQSQVSKLNALITDLLDISKIENGKLKITKKNFDFENLLSNAIDIIYQTHDNNTMVIERQGDRIADAFLGDEIRIEQVLINYLTNAIKYAPNTDRIIVHTEKNDHQVKVSVTDFGIGIPEHKQKNIFGKFYRVEESSVRFQGLGIGLYICSEIIKQHNGTVGIQSELGQGSTFYFTLPLN
ncbi:MULTISPECIES: ATP-binding response regulator [Sphingobacterium]|jgi:signal transduction histidine kinase|uniref:ATP-binding response regulator n=1 Tax=Sphingobacterium TaxID=28453 RepID=UPI0004E5FE1A|nr:MULTISPECIES: ATP-binding protein [Sphingobacterium]UXD70633.1 ATP-binding protein [Sphingobacterium faecium]WGQ14204.1 ATP-binding protein [Sphingobacterium faecium]CDT06237.1 Response regulator/sensor histidine kinase [Sphingobacterium sp. PM2-P1-29]SJN51746.1 response regulator receiver sensor signal transduction histidine kinase [Sphingobacterium faecium PCAi_F2.5]